MRLDFMGVQLGSAYGKIIIDASGATSGTQAASGALRGLDGVSAGLNSTLRAVGVGLGIVTAALGFAGKAALDSIAEYERLSMSLDTLVAREIKNSGVTDDMSEALAMASDRSRELLDWTQRLAIESPFDLSGVSKAFQTALAYGFVSDQAQELTEVMIDFAAGAGKDSSVMNQMALALGQIHAKGHLAGQEILQLVNAGVPVNDILSEMGYTLDDVSKGLVSADDFLAAFTKTMQEDFGGAAKRQSESWAGLLNTFDDLKKMGLRELFGGIFDALQPVAIAFSDWLQGSGLDKLRSLGDELGELTRVLLDKLPEAVAWLQEELAPVFDFVAEHAEAFKAALLGISAALAIGGTIMAIGAVLGALTSPLGLILAAVGLLSAAWAEDWGGIREIMTGVWAWLQPILQDLWGWIQVNLPIALQALSGFWTGTLLPALQAVGAWITGTLIPFLSQLWGWLATTIPAALRTLSGFWTGTLLPALQAVGAWVQGVGLPFWSAFADVLSAVVGVAVTTLAGLWQNVLQPALQAVGGYLAGTLQPVLSRFGSYMSGTVAPVVERVGKFLGEAFVGALKAIGDWLGRLTGKLHDFASSLRDLELPSWLTPGSPTPWEIGLRGIADALQEVTQAQLPRLNAQLGVLPPPQMPAYATSVGGGVTSNSNGFGSIVNHNVFQFSDTTLDESQLARAMDRVALLQG